jgi:diaminopropionate ammonia-lyase
MVGAGFSRLEFDMGDRFLFHLNAAPRSAARCPLFSEHDFADLDAFYARHPRLQPTPLQPLPALASRLGIEMLWVKDESSRFGLNAFKSLGVRYAIDRLERNGALSRGATLVCASAGNHGRAVARAARDRGLRARVYMSASAAEAPVRAIASEGAEVTRVDGTYDEAVRVMAEEAARNEWTIISDTSWPGYDEIPRLIMLGYTRLVAEVGRQIEEPPHVVFAQGGVGGLVCGVACGLMRHFPAERPRLVACEPLHAACLLASARTGRVVKIADSFDTIMASLGCAEPSPAAWPAIAVLTDAFVAIPDDESIAAMRALARPDEHDPPVEAGPSGACGLGVLTAVMREPDLASVREHVGLTQRSHVLVINSEGATDPELYRQLVGVAS